MNENPMTIRLIAAVGENRELGLQGDMPWKRALKKDLAFFKKQTMGHPLLMGRKTLESLPGLLPGREHYVLSTRELPPREHLHVSDSLESLLQQVRADWQARAEQGTDAPLVLDVIGGGSLYAQMLDQADELVLTEIHSAFEADTWFPAFDPSAYERTVLDQQQDGGYEYEHVLYRRPEK